MKVLSICIPSYNRFATLNATLQSIFSSRSDKFDVFVVDNESPVDVDQAIKIKDDRLHIERLNPPIPGPANVDTCVAYGDGLFSLLLLDKDTIDAADLEQFIDFLESLPVDIQGGNCKIDVIRSAGENELVRDNAILDFGYRDEHPSGVFYKSDTVKQVLERMPLSSQEHPFGYDILLTECATLGGMVHYCKPLIRTANINGLPGAADKSLSYRQDDGSLYFYPQNRIDSMSVYVHHLQGLDVSQEVFKKMLVYLYDKCLHQVTIEYRYILRQDGICNHYHVQPRIFTQAEMEHWACKAQEAFLALPIDEPLKSAVMAEVAARENERHQRRQDVFAACQSNQHVLLYGAGYVASQVLFDLQEAQVDIAGVLVSKKSEDISTFYGVPVYEVDEFIKSAEAPYFIVLVMNEYNQAEVRAKLSKLGLPAERIYAQPMGY